MKKLAYILIILSSIIIAVNIYDTDFENLKLTSFLNSISSVLLILAMIISIKNINKQSKNDI